MTKLHTGIIWLLAAAALAAVATVLGERPVQLDALAALAAVVGVVYLAFGYAKGEGWRLTRPAGRTRH